MVWKTHTIYSDRRKSGIASIGDLPWGSHFCQFYQTGDDLVEILVPYFNAGLENDEFCVWVTSKPLDAQCAVTALRKALPRFDEYARKGQIEIIPYRRIRHKGEDSDDEIIISFLDRAISSGFDGLRFACNAVPREKGRGFHCLGTDVVSRYNVIAAFAYPRDKFDAIGLMQVVKSHRFALVRNAGRWEVIESSEARVVKDALRRSEEKLQSLFRNMSEGFAYHRIVLDSEGRPVDYIFLEANEAFERLTGLRAGNIIGRKATEVLAGIDTDPADWIGKYGKVALTGKPAHFESYSEALERWYLVAAFSPHKGYFAVTFSDISERKRTEEELRRNREWLRVTLSSIGDAVLATDASGRITFLNPVAVDLTGWQAEEALDRPIQSVFHIVNEQTRQPAENIVERVLREGRIVSLANHMALVTRDGREIPIEDSAAPIRDGQGNLVGVVLVFHDVTAKRRAQTALRKSHTELEVSVRERTAELTTTIARLELLNQELQEFAHVASHDLQEPLRKIQTFCDMAKKRCAPVLDSTGQEYLDRVLNSASRMRQLLRDLLLFSRIATKPEPFKEIDLVRIVREAADVFEATIAETGCRIDIGNMPAIEADESQMIRLFQNLIGNALKFRGTRTPHIRIRGKLDGRGLCEVVVKDNGIGFDERFAELIFKPFQRLHGRSEYDGTGMGLAICRKIVERHGGGIDARGKPGEGATFIIRLPAKQTRLEDISAGQRP